MAAAHVFVFLCIQIGFAVSERQVIDCSTDTNVVTVYLEDTLQKGDTAVYVTPDTTLSECKIYQRINSTVVLTENLTSVCEMQDEGCKVNIPCNSTDKEIFIVTSINRTSRYDLQFKRGQYVANITEMVPINTGIVLTDMPTLSMHCSVGDLPSNKFFAIIKTLDVPFFIDAVTRIDIKTNGSIDYEKTTRYALKIIGYFNEYTATGTTTIEVYVTDIDDNSPRFNIPSGQNYQLYVKEADKASLNTPLSSVPPIHAYDPDFGLNATIKYNIIGSDPHQHIFTIDESTGTINISKELDYENVSQYRLTIKAYEVDKPNSRTAVAILTIHVLDIDDHLPYFNPDYTTIRIKEHAAVDTTVAYIHAIDEDSGVNGFITYRIGNANSPFEIKNFTNDTGALVVKDSVDLDREGIPTFNLTITPISHNGTEGTINLTMNIKLLDINDNNPNFTQSSYTFNDISETLSVEGNVIARVEAHDNDEGGNGDVTYMVLTSTVNTGDCTQNHLPFIVNKTSGELVMTSTGMSCDVYRFVVQACDNPAEEKHESFRCSVASVSVSSLSSNGTNYLGQRFSIPEGLPKDTYIGPITCSGEYTIAGQSNSFKINNTGLMTAAVLDREQVPSYTLNVSVSRQSQVACVVIVTVTLIDVNDNAPNFTQTSYRFNLPVDVQPHTSIARVEASDADIGANGAISYSLGNEIINSFSINSSTGEIFVEQPDMISPDITQLVVIASDGGVPSLQSTIMVYIITNSSVGASVPISTPMTLEQIDQTREKLTRQISSILKINVTIKHREEVVDNTENRTSTIRSRIYIAATDVTVNQQTFMSGVFNHYEAIRALFYEPMEANGSNHDDNALGAPEIGLIAMAVVILVGAIFAVLLIHRQFNGHKRYKQLYENLTKDSSLYESQEIKVTMSEETSDYNGSVNTQEIAETDVKAANFGVSSSVNPAYVSDDTVVVGETDVTIEHLNGTQSETADATTELESLDQRLDKEDEYEGKDSIANASGQTDTTEADGDANGNVVYANVTIGQNYNDDLVQFGDGSSEVAQDNHMETVEDGFGKQEDENAEDEPNPDYDIKAVRFHTEVLDADENKLQPLKVKEEEPLFESEADGVATDEKINDETNNDNNTSTSSVANEESGRDSPAPKDNNGDGEDHEVEQNVTQGIENEDLDTSGDGERLEEEINSPDFRETVPDEFYFGEEETTYF